MPEPLPNVISRKKLQYRAQATPFLYDTVFVYDLARTAMTPPSARKYPMDRQRRKTTVSAGTFRISRNPSTKLSRKNTTRMTAIKITTATFHHFLFFTVKLFHLTSFQYSLLFFHPFIAMVDIFRMAHTPDWSDLLWIRCTPAGSSL